MIADFNNALLQPFAKAFGEQVELLNAHQKNWLARRYEALEDGARLIETMLAERDPGARAAARDICLSNAFKRFVADMNDRRDEITRLALLSQQPILALWPRQFGGKTEEPGPQSVISGAKVERKHRALHDKAA